MRARKLEANRRGGWEHAAARSAALLLVGLTALTGASGCGTPASSPDAGGTTDARGDATAADLARGDAVGSSLCPGPGASECAGEATRRCERDGRGVLRWSAPVPCKPGEYCVAGACAAPTAKQQRWASELEAFATALRQTSGWVDDLPVDVAALAAAARSIVFHGAEEDGVMFRAARRVLVGFPIGHAGLDAGLRCGKPDAPMSELSTLGVCAHPYQDHFVVTHAEATNPLKLAPGDRVTAVDGLRGKALVEELYLRTICAGSTATEGAKHAQVAASLFGALAPGVTLTVVSPSGATRTVKLEKPGTGGLWCRYRGAPAAPPVIAATLRPDGVGVIRLTGFTPAGGFKGKTMPELLAEIEAFKKELAVEFAKVKQAKGLIWDVRGNTGGATPVGLAIVGGFPGVRTTKIAHCDSRIPYSEPPAFYGGESAFDYVVAPDPLFAFTGKVAVLVDGLAVSAADYFLRAVAEATNVPRVGAAPAGGFGGGVVTIEVSRDPALYAASDTARCVDADGKALEGRAVVPTHPLEYRPADLAAGVDTLLEAAAALVKP